MRQDSAKQNMMIVITITVLCFCCPGIGAAEPKKGLLVYDSHYGSTPEVAYWIRAIIGNEQYLDVKRIDQVVTVTPYDYVIIGSNTKQEKPSKRIYAFVENYKQELAQKQVCYFLVCGDWDETSLLKVPGGPVHLVSGRNYLYDIQQKYPDIKPVVIGGFGGRQVTPSLEGMDSIQIWLLEKVAKEGCGWVGLDVWESLAPERVEAFANEVRVNVLGLQPRADAQQYRFYWESLQPGSRQDPDKKKYTPKPYTVHTTTAKLYYSRSRIKGDLETATTLLKQWAQKQGITLQEQRKTFFNIYYYAVKNINGQDMIIHAVAATMPEDSGSVHIALRTYGKPEGRKPLEAAIDNAEQVLWAGGRKIEGR